MGSKPGPAALHKEDYAGGVPGNQHPKMVNRILEPTITQDWISGYPSTVYVDKTVWCSISNEDQLMLRATAIIKFYENPESRGTCLVWNIVPDDQDIDRKLLYEVDTAPSEKCLDRAVRLIRMIWNSRQPGDQRENEELLRQSIISSGKRLRLFPWIDEKLPTADFSDPKFNVFGYGPHESNRWDSHHFYTIQADLEKTQPTEAAVQWIRQHAQWIVTHPKHPGVFTKDHDIRELCLQARTAAMMKYLDSHKYIAEQAAHDEWSWYSIITDQLRESAMVTTCPRGAVGALKPSTDPAEPVFLQEYRSGSRTPSTSDSRPKTRHQTRLDYLMDNIVYPSPSTSVPDGEELVGSAQGRRLHRRSTAHA
jgi:hypothetical protein